MDLTSDIQGHGESGSSESSSGSGSGPGRREITPEEFAALLNAAGRTLWCVAAAVTGDRDRASDVVQEAALVALGKLGEFDPETSFHAWMSQIVRYVALNDRRRAQRRAGRADPRVLDAARAAPSERTEHRSLGALLSDKQAFDDAVNRALGTLDETARACLLMKIVLGLSYTDIARTLAIPEGTAMSHVHRARKAMRTAIKAERGAS